MSQKRCDDVMRAHHYLQRIGHDSCRTVGHLGVKRAAACNYILRWTCGPAHRALQVENRKSSADSHHSILRDHAAFKRRKLATMRRRASKGRVNEKPGHVV